VGEVIWYGEVVCCCFGCESALENLLRFCLEDAQSGGGDDGFVGCM
jgi:hypothetical protein